jgi:hypothetical protein
MGHFPLDYLAMKHFYTSQKEKCWGTSQIDRATHEIDRLSREFDLRFERLVALWERYERKIGNIINDVRVESLDQFELDPAMISDLNSIVDPEQEFIMEMFDIVTKILMHHRTRKQTQVICRAVNKVWSGMANPGATPDK